MLNNVTAFRPLEDFATLPPKLAALHAWWRAKQEAKAGALPSRGDVDPAELRHMLPHIALVDVLRDPLDWRYRLVGTRLVEVMGGERTGKRMRELLTPPAIEGSVVLMTRLLETRMPLAFTGTLYWLEREYVGFHALALPLSSTGADIDMAVMGLDFGIPDAGP
ncbi:MAG: PAS domain-containing protein [Parvibaculaceae bacterium]|nr:PAS domain-containing protein [Parvibaculaceae bacterium]